MSGKLSWSINTRCDWAAVCFTSRETRLCHCLGSAGEKRMNMTATEGHDTFDASRKQWGQHAAISIAVILKRNNAKRRFDCD